MNRLNRKVEYALIALKYMSSKFSGQLTTVKEICQITGVPFDGTSRVMQLMSQKGILKAEHGAHGGYLIIRDLSKVSFLEILETIAGTLSSTRCANGATDCEFFVTCNINSPMQAFNERLGDFYRSISIEELIGNREWKPRRLQEKCSEKIIAEIEA